jgi:hypothetical protein
MVAPDFFTVEVDKAQVQVVDQRFAGVVIPGQDGPKKTWLGELERASPGLAGRQARRALKQGRLGRGQGAGQ